MNFNFLSLLLFVSTVLASTAHAASKEELVEKTFALDQGFYGKQTEIADFRKMSDADLADSFQEHCNTAAHVFALYYFGHSANKKELGRAVFGDFNVQRINHLAEIERNPERPITFKDMTRYLPESMITEDLRAALENHVIKVRIIKKMFKMDGSYSNERDYIRLLVTKNLSEVYDKYTRLGGTFNTQDALIESIRKEIEDEQKAIDIQQQAAESKNQATEKENFWATFKSIAFWTLIVALIAGAAAAGYLFVMKKPTEVSSESTEVKEKEDAV